MLKARAQLGTRRDGGHTQDQARALVRPVIALRRGGCGGYSTRWCVSALHGQDPGAPCSVNAAVLSVMGGLASRRYAEGMLQSGRDGAALAVALVGSHTDGGTGGSIGMSATITRVRTLPARESSADDTIAGHTSGTLDGHSGGANLAHNMGSYDAPVHATGACLVRGLMRVAGVGAVQTAMILLAVRARLRRRV